MYQKINLTTQVVESVGPLPDYLKGLEDASLANMSWCDSYPELRNYGFIPVSVDPIDQQVLSWINAQRAIRNLPPVA